MKNILIADDNEDIIFAVKAVLAGDKYNCLSANDGDEALAIIYKEKVDLLVLDLMMPKMNGWQTMNNLKEHGINMPVIVLTARDEPFIEKWVNNFGASIIVKPFDKDKLIDLINEKLNSG